MQTKVTQRSTQLGPLVRAPRFIVALAAACLVSGADIHADEVTEWNAHAVQVLLDTGASPFQWRTMAIVHAAIYDAVNGIQQKYTPYFVTEWGPRGASAEAAAAQAGYTTLVTLHPSQKATLDAQLASSLAKLPGNGTHNRRVQVGLAWGEYVANQILAWRSTDGFTTPLPGYFGGGAAGVWRSPPAGTNADGTLPAIFPQLALLVPFTMLSHDQFRPGPPPALTSALYAADLNEVKAVGRIDSTVRTPEQAQIANLWANVGLPNENDAIRPVVESYGRHFALVDTARIFALSNFAAEDAIIAGFDCKYTYNLWRPYHAIRLADTDGNPDTEADPNWNSLIPAPRHQEYVSNHAIITTAFMHTLAELLGDEHTYTISSPTYPGYSSTFTRFSDAAAQARDARIFAGIHFRNSCNVGGEQGVKISKHAVHNFLLPLHEGHEHHSPMNREGDQDRD